MTTISKTPRWVRILLVLSLAVNLLVAGLAIGIAFGGKERAQPVTSRAGPAMLRSLPREERRALGSALRRENQARGLGREANQAARAEVVAALRATPFDAVGLLQALRAQAKLDAARRDVGLELVAERLARLSDEERATLAEDMLRPRRSPDRNRSGQRIRKP